MGIRDLFADHPTFGKAFIVALFIIAINALTFNALIHPTGTGLTFLSCNKKITICSGLLVNGGFYWNIFLIALISVAFDLFLTPTHRIMFEEAIIAGLLGALLLSSVSVLQPFAYVPLFIVFTLDLLFSYIMGSKLHKRNSSKGIRRD